MARAKENVLSELGSATVALDAAADTEVVLYTTLTGKKMVPVLVILDEFDEAVDEAVVSMGKGGGDCNQFLAAQNLTNVGVGFADEALICQPVPGPTPPASLVLDAGETFAVEITTPETTGAASCRAAVWGREKDA